MLDFTKEYILENEKIILRPLVVSDYDLLLPFSINEPSLWQYNANAPNSPENLKKYISTALQNRVLKTDYPFIVIDKITKKAIGSTRFYAVNVENKTLEIGYTWYGKDYQGTFVNKHCKYLLLAFAFEELQIERVGFRANSANQRSIAAMKKIGCIEEGILRNFSTDANGNRIDAMVLSIIRKEWFASVKENLKQRL